VVQYHGLQDSVAHPSLPLHSPTPLTHAQLIPSGNSRRYHASVVRTLGRRAVDSFYRYFPVPGMDHCAGGPGPNAFGQGGYAFDGIPKDAGHNIVLAAVRWVEEGVAPEQLVATKWKDDKVGVLQSRRTICAWPKRSVKRGGTYVCL
jgi:feruloyl esterase